MGKLEGQGWGTHLKDGGMELRGWKGRSPIVREAKHIYPIELKVMTLGLPAWMDNGGCTELTHQELVCMTSQHGRYDCYDEGTKAVLMIWRQRLGHKTVVELAPEWYEQD